MSQFGDTLAVGVCDELSDDNASRFGPDILVFVCADTETLLKSDYSQREHGNENLHFHCIFMSHSRLTQGEELLKLAKLNLNRPSITPETPYLGSIPSQPV